MYLNLENKIYVYKCLFFIKVIRDIVWAKG